MIEPYQPDRCKVLKQLIVTVQVLAFLTIPAGISVLLSLWGIYLCGELEREHIDTRSTRRYFLWMIVLTIALATIIVISYYTLRYIQEQQQERLERERLLRQLERQFEMMPHKHRQEYNYDY